jgi:hypothetical protein
LPIGGLELREIAGDALVYSLETPLHLGLGEVLVPRIDGVELRPVDTALGTARDALLASFQCGTAGAHAPRGGPLAARYAHLHIGRHRVYYGSRRRAIYEGAVMRLRPVL